MTTKTKSITAPTGTDIQNHITGVIHRQARDGEEAIKTLTKRMGDVRATITSDAIAGGDLARALLDGETFDPKKSAADAKRDATTRLAAKAEGDRLEAAIHALRTAIKNTPADTQADTLGYLRATLEDVVGEAATLAERHPHPVTLTAAEADPTLIEVTQAQTRLVGAYRTIRRLQNRTYRDPKITPDIIRESGMLADALEHEAAWTSRRRHVAANRSHMSRLGAGGHDRAAQWFTDAPILPWLPVTSTDGIAAETIDSSGDDNAWRYLAWIATNAEPWLPDEDELLEAHQRNARVFLKPTSRGRVTIRND